jgi:K+/H+ antiporter YhaU regulatory subunit KhtT
VRRNIVTIDEEGNPTQEETVVLPDPDEKLEESDVLLVVGENRNIEDLRDV